jgi:hypothetical protein
MAKKRAWTMLVLVLLAGGIALAVSSPRWFVPLAAEETDERRLASDVSPPSREVLDTERVPVNEPDGRVPNGSLVRDSGESQLVQEPSKEAARDVSWVRVPDSFFFSIEGWDVDELIACSDLNPLAKTLDESQYGKLSEAVTRNRRRVSGAIDVVNQAGLSELSRALAATNSMDAPGETHPFAYKEVVEADEEGRPRKSYTAHVTGSRKKVAGNSYVGVKDGKRVVIHMESSPLLKREQGTAAMEVMEGLIEITRCFESIACLTRVEADFLVFTIINAAVQFQ